MKLKELIKTTEAIVVFGGLFLTLTFGRAFAIATAVAYVVVNVPNIKNWIKGKLGI